MFYFLFLHKKIAFFRYPPKDILSKSINLQIRKLRFSAFKCVMVFYLWYSCSYCSLLLTVLKCSVCFVCFLVFLFSRFNYVDQCHFLLKCYSWTVSIWKHFYVSLHCFFTGGQSDQGYGSKDELIKEDAEINVPEEQVARELITKTKMQTEG